ncbi:hypothetical protein [Actinoplanes aureus]|uniref:Uncharacterized protein n=1 Tax=Actinoplanes aureus TaxID=2792083 RepID=A0A931CJD7_9ACTN|nr:hypothetical protein [Actinoplanes aureus]MBG0568433.1 hypothetical protein [Actinoplanes aureus]
MLVALVLGLVTLYLSVRSMLASERAAKTAAEALEESKKAVIVAERSAEAAAVSAREAEKLATIEATRHHDELGPNASVAFVWRPSRTGGAVFAEITNNSRYDYRVTGTHLIDGGATIPLSNDALAAGATRDLFIGHLKFDALDESPDE